MPPKKKKAPKIVVVKQVKTARRKKKRSRQAKGKHPLDVYRESLSNPFRASIPKLGIGTMVPTAIHSGFQRTSYPLAATTTAFMVATLPGMASNQYFTQNTLSSNPTGISTGSIVGPVNTTQLLAQVQSARIVSAAIRATVSTPSTVRPGNLYVLFLADETLQNLGAPTFDALSSFKNVERCFADTACTVSGEAQYRPTDTVSLAFQPLYASAPSITAANPLLVIFGTGWPAGSGNMSVDVDVVWNYETIGGMDPSGDDESSLADVVDGITTDNLLRNGPTGLPYKLSAGAIEMMDQALSTVHHSLRRTGWGLGGRGTNRPAAPNMGYSGALRSLRNLGISSGSASSAPQGTPASGWFKV